MLAVNALFWRHHADVASALPSLGEKTPLTVFLSMCIPQWMDGRGWAWTKAQLQVIAAHYQKAALIQNSGD